MTEGIDHRHPQYFLYCLEEHVLSPIEAAFNLVDEERTEITDELTAFKDFRERLADINPVTVAESEIPTERFKHRERATEQMECVRTAYRETVMDTHHYDRIYGESLVEHMAGELGPEVASGVRAGSSIVFSTSFRDVLRKGVTQEIQRREKFYKILDREVASLEDALTGLSNILASLDTTVIPEWHCDSLVERIDDVAQQRQGILQTRATSPFLGDHSLCAYLYGEARWSFPVLTAATRTWESISFDEKLDEHPVAVVS